MKPTISVIIPAYNEELLLPRALRALKRQDYKLPPAHAGRYFEIIVIDNASTDLTSQTAQKYGVRVISEPQKGYAYALSRGFREAKGEIVCVTDADSIVPQNWVSEIWKHFKKEPTAVAFGGNLELCDCHQILRQASKIICRFNYHYLSGANMAIKKEAFFKASKGKLRVNFGAELYLVKRLKKMGKIIFDPNLTVKTSGRRLEADLPKTLSTYFLNDLWLYLFDKPRYENFTDVRTLKIAKDYNTVPVLLKAFINNLKTQSQALGAKLKSTSLEF